MANEIDMIGCTALNTVQVVAEYGALETLDFENLCRAAEANNLGKIIKIDSAGQELRRFRGQSVPDLKLWCLWTCTIVPKRRKCVRIIRASTPEDDGLNPVRLVRAFYPGYGGTQACNRPVERIVVILMIEKAESCREPGLNPRR